MVRQTMLVMLAALAFMCVGTACPATAKADHPDLFYNFYNGPSVGGGVPAQLYVAPRPTPPLVGHTWITYQPLMPHEFLYHHHRTYYKYNRYGGHTVAHIRWH